MAMSVPRDTSPKAWEMYMATIRGIPPEERVQRAIRMSDDLRSIVREGIRSRHPDWTQTEVQEELEERMLGREVARAVRAARPGAPG